MVKDKASKSTSLEEIESSERKSLEPSVNSKKESRKTVRSMFKYIGRSLKQILSEDPESNLTRWLQRWREDILPNHLNNRNAKHIEEIVKEYTLNGEIISLPLLSLLATNFGDKDTKIYFQTEKEVYAIKVSTPDVSDISESEKGKVFKWKCGNCSHKGYLPPYSRCPKCGKSIKQVRF